MQKAIHKEAGADVPKKQEKVDVIVSVDDRYLEHIAEVVGKLEGIGLQVQQALKTLGVIEGSIDTNKVALLSGIEGVVHVDLSRKFQLAPPEAEVQ